MNPDNNALNRTYYIGGAPRIGKSILAYALAEKIKGHVVSTDAIRDAAKKACTDKNSDLFILNKSENISDEEWLKNHKESPETTVTNQNKESRAFWPSIVSFCSSFCEDSANHIVEGVALLPELVAGMKDRPAHVLYIGNTSDDHLQAMLDYGKQFPEQDWMVAMGYGPERMAGMAVFVKVMSEYFKSEARKYGFPYYEIDDKDFKGSLDKIISNYA